VTIGRAIPLTWEQATVTATAEGMRFTIPVITSANRIWRTGQGRTYKAKGAGADEMQARTRFPRVAQSGALTVRITWFRKTRSGDTDNRIKPTLDLLRGIAYHDDASICRIEAERIDDGSPARIVVDVVPYTEPNRRAA